MWVINVIKTHHLQSVMNDYIDRFSVGWWLLTPSSVGIAGQCASVCFLYASSPSQRSSLVLVCPHKGWLKVPDSPP
jgi:hypothetical protein